MNTIILITCGALFVLILFFTLILFFRGRAQKPLKYEPARFGILTTCLLRLSGHHPSEFDRLHPSVAWRFAACGLSVLVPPIIAAFGILLAGRVFNIGGTLGWAVAAGVFILMIDFVLVATLGGGKGNHTGWILVAYRALLALGIGWFIARPAILLAYGQAIDGLNRRNHWEEIRKTTEERESLKRNSVSAHQPLAEHYATRRTLLEEELKAVIASKAPVNQRILEKEREREEEDLKGLDGRKPGRGDFYKIRVDYLTEQKEKLAKIEKEENRLQSELATLATSSEEQLRKTNDDPTLKALDEAASKQIYELKDSIAGWSEREDLMMKWVMAEPLKRLPGFIMIHGVLLLLDLLPLLTMLYVPRTELDKIHHIQDARLTAEAECAEKAAKEGVEETMQERLTRDRLRESTATLREISDLRFDYAGHQTLRYLQAEASLRPVFLKLRFANSKPTPEQEAEWVEASKLLRKAMERNLRDFDNLVE